MHKIILEEHDLIRLNSLEDVEYISESNNTITGINQSGEIVRFNYNDIKCIKKHGLKPCGGDNENFWMFYTGPGYKTTDIDIANWARFEIPQLFDQFDDEEIIRRHLYWGTESPSFSGMYNGDTYILYYNINLLSSAFKEDAENSRK